MPCNPSIGVSNFKRGELNLQLRGSEAFKRPLYTYLGSMLLFILGRVEQVPLEINVQPGLDYLVKPIMDSNFKTSLDRSFNPSNRDTHFPPVI